MGLSAWAFKAQTEKHWIDAGYKSDQVRECLANTETYLKNGCPSCNNLIQVRPDAFKAINSNTIITDNIQTHEVVSVKEEVVTAPVAVVET